MTNNFGRGVMLTEGQKWLEWKDVAEFQSTVQTSWKVLDKDRLIVYLTCAKYCGWWDPLKELIWQNDFHLEGNLKIIVP